MLRGAVHRFRRRPRGGAGSGVRAPVVAVRRVGADAERPRDDDEEPEPDQLECTEEEEVVVEVTLVTDARRVGATGDVTVDVAVVPVEEPRATESEEGGGAEHAADALREPEEAHDAALHAARGVDVGELQA